ncbi:MAG: hypothetical protein ACREL3_07710 [Gemmatimonadales bacterium]
MAPEHLKATATILALVSLTLLALAAGDWDSAGRSDANPDPPERAGWRGGVTLFAVSMLVAGSLWGLSDANGWARERVFWVGCGAFLCVMTLFRPWWFWENYKARWLRNTIGDEPTALIYLALSAACIWVGLFTNWTFGRR